MNTDVQFDVTGTLAKHTFIKGYEQKLKPVIFRSLLEDWPALERWKNLDYWREKIGERLLSVERYPDTEYLWEQRSLVRMKGKAFIDAVSSSTGEVVFLADTPLHDKKLSTSPRCISEVADDVVVPDLFSPEEHRSTALFFGRDTISQCHFHPTSQAIICQVVGRKTLVMIPPEALPYLDAYPWYTHNSNWSQIKFERHGLPVSLQQSGLPFTPSLITLEPGDALFIPMNWWHAAFGKGLSLSVTFFWNSRPSQVLLNKYLLRAGRFRIRELQEKYAPKVN